MNSELTDGAKSYLKSKGVEEKDMKRKQVPTGWWNKVNGTEFVLPYPTKARLQRVTIRSKIQNIKEGFIYPYDANREDRWIPEKFPLSYENGVFIGLFIADGCIDSLQTIKITKEDPSVLEFVKKWFDTFNITYKVVNNKKERGYTTEIHGSCAILSKFITYLVGHLAHNKHIPDIAYVAPKEFIRGLISGYFSGDGSISESGITCSSVSKKLIDGMGQLLSRFGIFGKVSKQVVESNNLGTVNIKPIYNISIRAQWAKIFQEEIVLINKPKNDKLQEMKPAKEHRNYTSKGDVVLDPVVSIKPIDPKKHPKMYDVTVPKTLNFSLYNSLNLYDTSSTGYCQRRMIKMVEDLRFGYSNLVTNASENVVQFMYGDDNFDASKLIKTSHGLSFIDINHVCEKLNNNIEFNHKD
jgi:intein/homing endonuclease